MDNGESLESRLGKFYIQCKCSDDGREESINGEEREEKVTMSIIYINSCIIYVSCHDEDDEEKRKLLSLFYFLTQNRKRKQRERKNVKEKLILLNVYSSIFHKYEKGI